MILLSRGLLRPRRARARGGRQADILRSVRSTAGVRVRPLLTPDNYQREVLELIGEARSKILSRTNRSSVLAENEDRATRSCSRP